MVFSFISKYFFAVSVNSLSLLSVALYINSTTFCWSSVVVVKGLYCLIASSFATNNTFTPSCSTRLLTYPSTSRISIPERSKSSKMMSFPERSIDSKSFCISSSECERSIPKKLVTPFNIVFVANFPASIFSELLFKNFARLSKYKALLISESSFKPYRDTTRHL